MICIGKTGKKFLEQGEQEYLMRLKHYLPIERVEIADLKNQKNMSVDEIKKQEGQKILAQLNDATAIFLLDDKGKSYSSLAFSAFLQKQFNQSMQQLVFVIGGAYGFSQEVYERATGKISLSAMTFSHQMIRLIFFEQVYRAMTILKGEKYHHE